MWSRTKVAYENYDALDDYFQTTRFKRGHKGWELVGHPKKGEWATYFDVATYHGSQEAFQAWQEEDGRIVVNEDLGWDDDFQPLTDAEAERYEELLEKA